jgi:hypothetical protein
METLNIYIPSQVNNRDESQKSRKFKIRFKTKKIGLIHREKITHMDYVHIPLPLFNRYMFLNLKIDSQKKRGIYIFFSNLFHESFLHFKSNRSDFPFFVNSENQSRSYDFLVLNYKKKIERFFFDKIEG